MFRVPSENARFCEKNTLPIQGFLNIFLAASLHRSSCKTKLTSNQKITAEHLGIKQLRIMFITFKTLSWLVILSGFLPPRVCLSPNFCGYSCLCIHWLLPKCKPCGKHLDCSNKPQNARLSNPIQHRCVRSGRDRVSCVGYCRL